MNHTDIRAKVEFNFTDFSPHISVANNTLFSKAKSDLESGDNVVFNDTSVREIHTVINGKNPDKHNLKMFT